MVKGILPPPEFADEGIFVAFQARAPCLQRLDIILRIPVALCDGVAVVACLLQDGQVGKGRTGKDRVQQEVPVLQLGTGAREALNGGCLKIERSVILRQLGTALEKVSVFLDRSAIPTRFVGGNVFG